MWVQTVILPLSKKRLWTALGKRHSTGVGRGFLDLGVEGSGGEKFHCEVG